MPRITPLQYKTALLARYRDLRDMMKADVQINGKNIDYDDKRIREMKTIASIAKLHGVDVKLIE